MVLNLVLPETDGIELMRTVPELGELPGPRRYHRERP